MHCVIPIKFASRQRKLSRKMLRNNECISTCGTKLSTHLYEWIMASESPKHIVFDVILHKAVAAATIAIALMFVFNGKTCAGSIHWYVSHPWLFISDNATLNQHSRCVQFTSECLSQHRQYIRNIDSPVMKTVREAFCLCMSTIDTSVRPNRFVSVNRATPVEHGTESMVGYTNRSMICS